MDDARLQYTRSSFRTAGSRNVNERGNRPERKKSAAERLEADKIKYVKSAHVREKRITAVESEETTRRGKHNKMILGSSGGCVKRSAPELKKSSSSSKEDSTSSSSGAAPPRHVTPSSQAKRAQVPKMMSTSVSHPQNTTSITTVDNTMMVTRSLASNAPRQRRSWSKNPHMDARKNNQNNRRTTLVEGNRPGSRKSISERLEEIFTPLEDMDTNNMPPPQQTTPMNVVVPPPSCYENTPTESNTVIAAHNNQTAIIAESPMPAVVPVSTTNAGQAVYGRVDKAPMCEHKNFPPPNNRVFKGVVPQSPSLAPRTRREVAPTDKKKANEQHLQQRNNEMRLQDGNNHHYVDKHQPTTTTNSSSEEIRPQSTLRSHTTSSSAATSATADVSKPLTALTASDLKPRRTKRNTTSTSVTPLRAAHPYPHNCHADKMRRQVPSSTPPQSPHRPPSSRRNSYHQQQQHRGSNGSILQDRSEVAKLNNFFATMGGYMPSHSSNENICFNFTDCESDFSFAGASAYVREDGEFGMEVEMGKPEPYPAPSVSIIEKRARIMKWILSCRNQMNQQQSSLHGYVTPKESSV